MPIEKLSSRRRLPRIGKIFLGIKIKKTCDKCKGKKVINNKDCRKCLGEGFIEYPKEVEYFVVDKQPEIVEYYGNKPTEILIMFPVDSNEVVFSQFYKRYGYGILRCIGDGNKGTCWDEEHGGLTEIDCPCEHLETDACKPVAILQFLLLRPEKDTFVPIGSAVYQISTSSKNSIIDVNSGLDYIRTVCGHADMIPLILRRAPLVTQRVEVVPKEKKFKLKKATHFTLQFAFDKMNLIKLQRLALKKPSEALLLDRPDHTKVPEEIFPPHGFLSEEETKKIKAQSEEEEKKKEKVEKIKAEEEKKEEAKAEKETKKEKEAETDHDVDETEEKEEPSKEETEEPKKEEEAPKAEWTEDEKPDTGEKTFKALKEKEKDVITLDNMRNSLNRNITRLAGVGGDVTHEESEEISALIKEPTVKGYTKLINHFSDRIQELKKLKFNQ